MAIASDPDKPAVPQKIGRPADRIPGHGAAVEAGDFTGFALRAAFEIGGGFRYFGELVRQAGVLIAGSALVLIGVAFVAGGECGLFGDYFLRSVGAQSYVGAFTSACGKREIVPQFFGYILAAKVGCGLVAEIGSMRISEELDAMESLGISPMRYVVATRVLAAVIVIPLIYLVAMFIGDLGSFVVVVINIGDVSRAAFEGVHWSTQNLGDTGASLLKVVAFTVAIVLVGCYYGYRASGGAVGVGAATAKSMVVNLTLVNVINAIGTALFFAHANVPFGG